jgi:hypothetical protein
MQELIEYEIVQQALERIETNSNVNGPTNLQRVMAIVPILIVMMCSMIILYYAYDARGVPSMEQSAPIYATILSIVMMIMEIAMICYQHHDRYTSIRTIAEIMIRFNFFHLIICGSFITYVKNSGNYPTYFTWVCTLTIPIYLLSLSPFVCGILSAYS